MKKFIAFLIMFMFAFSMTTLYATEKVSDSKEQVIYLESYEEYQKLLQEMDGSDRAKAGYMERLFETMFYNIPVPTYKARVLSVGEKTTEFDGDENNGYDMYVYQNMAIEILEGEYAGQRFEECTYPIKVDSFYNIKRSEVIPGDVVFVSVYEDAEGVYPYIQYIDSSISKIRFTVMLFVITVVMIGIYTGKYSVQILLPIVLLIDLLFVVFAEFVLNYIGVWAAFVAIILLVAIAFFAIRLGVNSKLFTGIISLTVILVVMAFLMYGFDALANITGVSYEVANLAECVSPVIIGESIVPAIDFHALSVGITILIMTITLIPIIAKTIETLEQGDEKKDELKKYLAEKILVVASMLMIVMLQKYMVIYLNAAQMGQILNSEALTIEFARMLFVIIAMALSVTITEIVSKLLED